MFFADTGNGDDFVPRIERAFMDGTFRFQLVTYKVLSPNDITVDYVNQRIYWTDSRLEHISSVDYYGKFR